MSLILWIKMILPIGVISLYCNIKDLFETWKYLYKSGSSDDKCIDSQHFGTCDSHTDFKVKRSKVKVTGGGILWRPPSRTACSSCSHVRANVVVQNCVTQVHCQGSGGQSSGSYEAKDRFGDVVEASFSTYLCRVAFLVVLHLVAAWRLISTRLLVWVAWRCVCAERQDRLRGNGSAKWSSEQSDTSSC